MLPFAYAARQLFRDPVRFFQKTGGAALVVFLFFAAGAFNLGMREVLRGTGSEVNVILLGAGSEESVQRSEVGVQVETLAAGIRGVERRLGVPAVSGEVHLMGYVVLEGREPSQALLRGVTPAAFEVHREVRLLKGRYPASGEALVGRLAHRSLGVEPEALRPGAVFDFEGQPFAVSGIFEAPGTVMESELWLERNDLMTAVRREALSCVVLRLEDPGQFANADLFARQRLDLELMALRESDYYAALARFYEPVRGMTWLTVALVAAGSVFGGLNVLYASFAARIRELATLQAIGFPRWSILLSLVQESLAASLLGTLLACLLALALLDGVAVAFSIGTFHLLLTPAVLAAGLLAGALLGILGALPPGIRCLSAPLPAALRSA